MLLGAVVTLGLTGLQGHFQDGSPSGKFLPGCSLSCGLCIGLLECSQPWQLLSSQASDLGKNKEKVICLSCHLTLFSGGPGTQNMKTRR